MPYKDPKVRKEKAAAYSKAHYEKNKKELIARGKLYKKNKDKNFFPKILFYAGLSIVCIPFFCFGADRFFG